ncbi:MAG: hypothetical protein ABR975_05400 [Vulcanimicrobiaceae bacterium]
MTIPEQALEIFVFGPFTLDTFARALDSHATAIRVEPPTFELLEYFVRHARETVTVDEIAELAGQGERFPEAAVRAQVEVLRATLARYSPRATFLVDDDGGYRFVAQVTRREPASGGGEVAARRWYARARYFFEKRTADSLHRSIYYYRRALEVAPRFGPAHAGLARAYTLSAEYLFIAPHEAYGAALASAQTALALAGPTLEAYLVLGQVACSYDRDFEAAEHWYATAKSADPHGSEPVLFAAWLDVIRGRADDAARALAVAVEAEPYATVLQTSLAVTMTFQRRFADAIVRLRAARALDVGSPHTRLYLAQALCLAGQYDEVVALSSEPCPDGYEQAFLAMRGSALAQRGDQDQARATAAAMRRLVERGRYVSPYLLSVIALGLGETDEVLALLERSLAERDPWIVQALHHPEFDRLRGEPRFEALLRRIPRPPV